LVVAERVAAVEVADAVSAPVGRRQPVGMALRRPRAAVVGPDRQRPELVEREAAIRVLAGHLLDPVQLFVTLGVAGLLPGPGALKRDLVGAQQLPQPLPPGLDHPDGVAGQVAGQLAGAPVGERAPQLLGARPGRLDDEPLLVRVDPAGTAPRPARVQHVKPRWLNAWITSRTVSASAWTSRAIAGTVVPLADAMTINARRTRIEPCLPRRTIRCSVCPSSSLSRRARTGSAIAPRTVDSTTSMPTVPPAPKAPASTRSR
jgi:hypothetical protein